MFNQIYNLVWANSNEFANSNDSGQAALYIGSSYKGRMILIICINEKDFKIGNAI